MSQTHQPAELSLDQCIKCNICVSECPVSAVTDLFPGPKYEGPQAGRFRHDGQVSPDHSVDYCSGCRVCNMVCPTGVKIAEINARARAGMVDDDIFTWRARVRNNLIARSELLGKVAQPLAPIANAALTNSLARWFAEATLGIARDAPLPAFADERFSEWLETHPRPAGDTRKVVYFHGCSTEYYEPRVGRAAIHVFEANGFEVLVPAQNCCGLPLLSNGEFGAARKYHEDNIRKLVGYVKQGYDIVGTSTSCTLTLKEEAPELLDMFDPDARLIAEHSYDFNEFLLNLAWDDALDTESLRPIPLELAYHSPCQYRAHRLGRPAVEILDLIPELTIIESQAACCGIAGTYGYKAEKYQIAMDVGQPLFEFVREVDGPVAVCDSETCRWQITHGSGVPAVHPVELLAASYGYPVEGALAEVI